MLPTLQNHVNGRPVMEHCKKNETIISSIGRKKGTFKFYAHIFEQQYWSFLNGSHKCTNLGSPARWLSFFYLQKAQIYAAKAVSNRKRFKHINPY